MTFVPAAEEIYQFKKVRVSEPTVRRDTENAGDAYAEVQMAQLEMLEKEAPPTPQGPPLQQMSVDGALVPLLHGEWSEVKTVAIGTVGERELVKGDWEVHTEDLSYFSRLTNSEEFARLATVETHRRGTETAGNVCAVNDGAEWEQKFVDLHRPDAVRILDWAHSSEYVAKAGQAVFGTGVVAASNWIGEQLHELKHGDPEKVLTELRRLRDEPTAVEGGLSSEAMRVVTESLEYLEKRRDLIRYAEFAAAGYPIGSGAVESGNKLVVEARLKGPGMHWAREHVDGMLALRNGICSGRWDECWAQTSARLRQKAAERSAERRRRRKEACITSIETQMLTLLLVALPSKPGAEVAVQNPVNARSADETQSSPRRPAPNHPWRHSPIGRGRYAEARQACSTES